MTNDKKIKIILGKALFYSFCAFTVSFMVNDALEMSFASFYLYFLVVLWGLLLSFAVSCCLRYKIWGNPVTSHKKIRLSFLLVIFVDCAFLWCFTNFTAITSPSFFSSEIFQHWWRFWINIFLLRWWLFNYPIHKAVLEMGQ